MARQEQESNQFIYKKISHGRVKKTIYTGATIDDAAHLRPSTELTPDKSPDEIKAFLTDFTPNRSPIRKSGRSRDRY